MDKYPINESNKVRRHPDRAQYEKDAVYQILDEALYCDVGSSRNNHPLVIPMAHARLNDLLYLHGAKSNALLENGQAGSPLCVSVTIVDGIVFARSAFKHSLNYRSAVLFGEGRPVAAENEKLQALEALTEHIAKGRWHDVRKPTQRELKATSIIAVNIETASVKTRSGPPSDDEGDYQLPVWAGVLPIQQTAQAPVNDPRLTDSFATPNYIANYQRDK